MQAIPPRRPISDFRAVWQTLGIEGATLHQPLGATRVPPLPVPSTDPRRALLRLPQLGMVAPTAEQPTHADLQVGGEIGRGGMGLVREATQVSLRRSVAVKTLHADKHTPDAVQELLRPLQTVLNPPALQRELAQLNGVVQEAVSLVEARATRQGISLEVTLDPTLPETVLDSGLMVQAVTNLLMNGIQALAVTEVKRLRVATRSSGESLQVVVQDTGVALADGRQAELFDPACATSTEALALPIADIITRQHGGRLGLRSQEGVGNAFLLEIPLTVPATPPVPKSVSAPAGLNGRRALVVDDESFLLECLVDALGAWGMEVASSTQGEEAIQQLQSGEFDVIVSDIRMPGLSGVDLYDWLKVQRPAMTRRILYTTGDSFDAKTRTFLETNQVPYLGKPFDLKQLKQSLERLLETPAEA